MRGVHITKANLVHEDPRRKLVELMNGEMNIKNIKILDVKEDSFLGGQTGHWHQYGEMMHILKGEAVNYVMENIDTGEKETFHLKEGDTVFRTGRIIHGGDFKKGTIVLDGSCEMFVSDDFNNIPREVTK